MSSTKASALAAWASDLGFELTRFDYSGHGLSGGRFEDATVGQWVEDAEAAIAQLSSGPQVLVGSSMGGWIALLIARNAAKVTSPLFGRISGLALIAPAWDMTEALMKKGLTAEAHRALEATGVWLRPSRYGDGPYPITRRLLEEGQRHSICGEGISINCPIRIIHGMQDADVPWRHSLELVSELAAADIRLTLVKDGEHRLSRASDLALLRSVIEEWLMNG